jgi:hypothetical protein
LAYSRSSIFAESMQHYRKTLAQADRFCTDCSRDKQSDPVVPGRCLLPQRVSHRGTSTSLGMCHKHILGEKMLTRRHIRHTSMALPTGMELAETLNICSTQAGRAQD